MNLIFIGLVGVAILMYLEGLLFSTVVINFSSIRNRWLKFIALLVWPVTVPYIAYSLYRAYAGLLMQLKDNPFLSAMLGPQLEEAFLCDPNQKLTEELSICDPIQKQTQFENLNCDKTKEIQDNN